MAKNDRHFDILQNADTGTLGTLAASGFIKLKLLIDGVEYENVEAFLNSQANASRETFMKKIVSVINALITVQNNGSGPPPVLGLWMVKADSGTPPTTLYTTASLETPNTMLLGISGAKKTYIGELTYRDTWRDESTTPDTNFFYYEGELSLKGDRENYDFFWSDEYQADPDNRTYFYVSVNGRTNNIEEMAFIGVGVGFVNYETIEESVR